MQSYDGVIQFQARSIFPKESEFCLSEAKLAHALSMISPPDKITETAENLILKRGPLSVRVRKLDFKLGFFDVFGMSKNAKSADGFLDSLKLVAPFMSEDATRAWSTSVLFKDGYAWATNNLALVRTPAPASLFKRAVAIPAAAVNHLCTLDAIDLIDLDDKGSVTVVAGKSGFRFTTMSTEWPESIKTMFAAMPKTLPPLPKEMVEATSTIAKLSNRFASLDARAVRSSTDQLDSTYEIEVAKGKGTFSARLLALIALYATHADFSFFPKPVFFKGEKIEGTAVGMHEPTTPKEKEQTR
jgi:hypothetical protein